FHAFAFQADRVVGVEIADDAFAASIDKERVAADMAVFHGGVAGQDFRVDITQDHLGGRPVVPRHHLRPQKRLLLQQRTQMVGAEMSQVQNLHAKWMMCLVCIDRGMKAHGTSQLPPCQYGTWRRAKSLASGRKLSKACICPGTKTVGTSGVTCH